MKYVFSEIFVVFCSLLTDMPLEDFLTLWREESETLFKARSDGIAKVRGFKVVGEKQVWNFLSTLYTLHQNHNHNLFDLRHACCMTGKLIELLRLYKCCNGMQAVVI